MSKIITVPFNDQLIGQGVNYDSRENVGTGLTVIHTRCPDTSRRLLKQNLRDSSLKLQIKEDEL